MSVNKIIIKNGLLIYSAIVVFFLLMKLLGLDDVSELRFVNFIFVLWGVNNAIKTHIKQHNENSYFSNLYIGFTTSVLGVALTIIGLIIHINFINPDFITVLENSHFWGKNLNLAMVTFALAIEGIASSLICSFILMQYYKGYKVPTINTV